MSKLASTSSRHHADNLARVERSWTVLSSHFLLLPLLPEAFPLDVDGGVEPLPEEEGSSWVTFPPSKPSTWSSRSVIVAVLAWDVSSLLGASCSSGPNACFVPSGKG